MCRASETPFERIESAIRELPGWLAGQSGSELGAAIIKGREVVDRMEAVNGEATRRFEKTGGYRADGALGMTPWLRTHGKLSAGAAAEHVETARQLEKLPRTEEALARGEIGYQHAVAMARTAEHVGAAQVRKAETMLLKAAGNMDPGQFASVTRDFEHRVDVEGALNDANRAHRRRYLQIGEAINGLVRIEGQVTPDAGAIIRTAIEPYARPPKGDDRSAGQRLADALVEVCRRGRSGQGSEVGHANGAGPRPQLVITAAADTLAGIEGAPAGQLEWAARCRPRRFAGSPVTPPSRGSPGSASSSGKSATRAARFRRLRGAHWWPAIITASFPVAIGRRPGATGIT
ncbi:MAG: DUF222 domain-containing protein [Chloroflexi bacterium]|nr:MAG: DUF222 domain-containing protein [Chloroflexota bacterium]